MPHPPCTGIAEMGPMGGGANPGLLPTIHVPRDIRLLPNHLPKPSYGNGNSSSLLQQQLPSREPSGYVGAVGSKAAGASAAAMAAAMAAAADWAAARAAQQRAAAPAPYLASPQQGNRASPRGPSPRLLAAAAGAGAGAAVGANGAARRPYGGNMYQPAVDGVLGMREAGGAAAAAAAVAPVGFGAGGRASPYGVGAGGLRPGSVSRLELEGRARQRLQQSWQIARRV